MGPLLRARDAAAARLRRPGAGAFLGAPRALPAVVRRREHAGVLPHHPRADVPHAAPADDPRLPQAAGSDEPEEPAPAQALGVGPRGFHRRRVPGRDRRDRRTGEGQGAAHPGVQRQGLLRSARSTARTRDHRLRDHPPRAALPVPARGDESGARSVSERGRAGLGAGRAAQPGRLVDAALHALPRRLLRRKQALDLRRAPLLGLTGRRLRVAASRAAGAIIDEALEISARQSSKQKKTA